MGDVTMGKMKASSKRIAQAAALLVLVSVAMLLVGNRWANYIVTPIPGLYLTDALFAAGSLLGLVRVSLLRQAPNWMRWLFLIVWSYTLFVLVPELFFVPATDRYNALRDAAPFLYLSLAPLAALSLTAVRGRSLVTAVRWSAVAAAVITLLTSLGVLKSFDSPILGSEFAQVFSSRPDLLGASVGIGIIAWGSWTASSQRGFLAVQGTLLLVSVSTIENRSGLIALLTATVIAVVREVRNSRNSVVPIGAITLVIAGLAVQVIGLPTLHTGTSTSTQPTSEPSSTTQSEPSSTTQSEPSSTTQSEPGRFELWIQDNIVKAGTANARLATWTDIVVGMTEDSTWMLGGSAGSDYMYELCTGIPVAPAYVLTGPKCAVDDHGPEPVVRDPHNWILNIVLYHGLIGLLVFSAALAVPAIRQRRSENAMLPIGGIVAYLISGMTFLISAGYALVPMSFFVAWLLRNAISEKSRAEAGLDST